MDAQKYQQSMPLTVTNDHAPISEEPLETKTTRAIQGEYAIDNSAKNSYHRAMQHLVEPYGQPYNPRGIVEYVKDLKVAAGIPPGEQLPKMTTPQEIKTTIHELLPQASMVDREAIVTNFTLMQREHYLKIQQQSDLSNESPQPEKLHTEEISLTR
jgi:hypothetical protein